jgi:hypothetical protein
MFCLHAVSLRTSVSYFFFGFFDFSADFLPVDRPAAALLFFCFGLEPEKIRSQPSENFSVDPVWTV